MGFSPYGQQLVSWINGIFDMIADAGGGGTSRSSIRSVPGLATGGTVMSGGLALVGEEGPELLRLPGGAQVTPLQSSGPGTSAAPQIHINITLKDINDIANQVERKLLSDLRRAGYKVSGMRV